ncbi:hypothetical protein [Dactylosporangium fulvum]|uniref:Condensation domain-containing protein n=1 Tax=Dactylosporangium fulvum TaxID=53359 RepID=A0ABY5W438_9ACTN|nr:hypothetical protein [Dactylosporangium fulvum]UWP84832.1 hypothetical protein Dfulv_11610 [Dactylosporangium fulvum]
MMRVLAEVVEVPFEGDGAGHGPLSWGQIESWNAVRALGHWMPLGGVEPIAPGTSLDDVLGELRYHMCRHATLRTRLHVPPDGGTPAQEVFARGTLTVEVYDDADPQEVAGRYRDRPLDFTAEWPIRAAVVRRDGVPAHLVAVVSHFATDGAGAKIMLREARERPDTPVEGLAPLEQARWQASPPGRRQNTAALRHLDGIVRTMPPVRFPVPDVPRNPRYWRAAFDSAALPLALRALTDRTDVDPAVSLLAVFAAAVAETSGIDPVVVRPLVSNRFRAGLGGVVCTAVQAGLCLIDTAGDFDDVVERARRAALAGYKYAYFDQRDLHALLDRTAAERGEQLQIGCFLNDRRGPVPMDAPPEAEIRAALPRSELRWITRQDRPALEPLIVDVEDGPDGYRLTLHSDTRWLAPEDAERLLWSMEAIAVRHAWPRRP